MAFRPRAVPELKEDINKSLSGNSHDEDAVEIKKARNHHNKMLVKRSKDFFNLWPNGF